MTSDFNLSIQVYAATEPLPVNKPFKASIIRR